jgi:hypothetical protein
MLCLLYIGIIFIVLYVLGVHVILKKARPQVFDDPQNNALPLVLTIAIILILTNEIGNVVLDWCNSGCWSCG